MKLNAKVEYVDGRGQVVAVDYFYDPGLDPNSEYSRERKVRRMWSGPHLAYGCGVKAIVLVAVILTVLGDSEFTLPVRPAGDCIGIKTYDMSAQIVEATGHARTFTVGPNTSVAFTSRGADGWKYVGRECRK